MTSSQRPLKPRTAMVWAEETEGHAFGAAVVPIVNAASFTHADLESWEAVATGKRDGYIYSRNTNPTVDLLERKIAALDGTEQATAFATGMAAISSALMALLSQGDRVVSVKDTYGGTNLIFETHLPRYGVEVCLCPTEDHEAIEAALTPESKVLYLETPTNPTLKVLDIARLARAARAVGAVTIVDNTFATPVNQRPAELGADLIVYSATKFLAGHSDVMGGLLSGRRALVEEVFRFREIAGASLHADAAYGILKGMKTLALRMAAHNANAQAVAEFLDRHPKVEAVFYPGLPDHPGHDIAAAQMTGYGGVLSFVPSGGAAGMGRVLDHLKLAQRAAHLGGPNTIAGPPRVTSHVELTEEERARAGIPEAMIRYSVGIEDADDLMADLDQALAQV